MTLSRRVPWAALAAALLLLGCAGAGGAWAADAAPALSMPGMQVRLAAGGPEQMSSAVKILMGLTVLSLAPAILMSMTSFIRIVIVLSMLPPSGACSLPSCFGAS